MFTIKIQVVLNRGKMYSLTNSQLNTAIIADTLQLYLLKYCSIVSVQCCNLVYQCSKTRMLFNLCVIGTLILQRYIISFEENNLFSCWVNAIHEKLILILNSCTSFIINYEYIYKISANCAFERLTWSCRNEYLRHC